MKTKIISYIVTIMLLSNTLFVVVFITKIEATNNNNDCDSSYPDACIPPYPPDLNCDDISDKNFEVLPPDPHGFDRDEDGIGCES